MNKQPYGTIAIIAGLGSLGEPFLAYQLAIAGIVTGIVSIATEDATVRAVIGIVAATAGLIYWLMG